MKKYFKDTFINLSGLFSVTLIMKEALTFSRGWETLLVAAAGLTVLNHLVKPIIKLIFLPINLITLGMFRWLTNVVILFLLTTFVGSFQINQFQFPGLHYQGSFLPPMQLGFFWTLTLTSFLLSLLTSFYYWLVD